MSAKIHPLVLTIALTSALIFLSGCDKSYFIAGNTASMFVTCVLFWSTLKLNRKSRDRDEM
ncbi:MAG: hypothetical protein H0U74_14400 [Bradymonadaceae bacterium]|nr:hypothetical protein [Lujinxingiaceae bacterium]